MPQWLIEEIGQAANTSLLFERKEANGALVARGLFAEADIVNGNGRKYPQALMEAQVAALQDRIAQHRVSCAMDHPPDGKGLLENAAARLTKLWMEGPKVLGEAVLLDTPKGQTLRKIIEGGLRVGVSSRGFGSTRKEEACEVVQEDYRLVTFDFVEDPSVSDALPKFYTESLEAPLADPDPVEMFRTVYPEAYASLTESAQQDAVTRAKEQTAKAIEAAVEDARTQVRTAMTETFERRLRDTVVQLREDLYQEFATDPAVGGAKAALAQVLEMVKPYAQQPHPDALRDALKARELELTAAQAEREQAEELAAVAKRLLTLEQRLSGHPLAPHLRAVLTPVISQGAVTDVETAVNTLLQESAHMVPASQVEALAQERLAEQETQDRLAEEIEKNTQLNEQVERLKNKLVRATEVGAELDAQAKAARAQHSTSEEAIQQLTEQVAQLELEVYKRERLVGIPNGRALLPLMEGATDQRMVDKVIDERRAQAMVDGRLEAARQAIRGKGPGAEVFRRLEERKEDLEEVAEDATEVPLAEHYVYPSGDLTAQQLKRLIS